MITWVTVWVLTVNTNVGSPSNTVYQLMYSNQKTCLTQAKKYQKAGYESPKARCDFQQVPMVTT